MSILAHNEENTTVEDKNDIKSGSWNDFVQKTLGYFYKLLDEILDFLSVIRKCIEYGAYYLETGVIWLGRAIIDISLILCDSSLKASIEIRKSAS